MGMATQAFLIGIVATIGMDLWATIVKYIFRLPATDWAMIGRWFGHMPRGVFVHHPISESPAIRHELAIGWIAHYVTGVVYGFLYLYIVVALFSSTPSLGSALVFGIATLVAPWFIMQPGLGMGVFATQAPRPDLIRLINLSMHVAFGASLFLGWLLLQLLTV
jgi:hypothetical protein